MVEAPEAAGDTMPAEPRTLRFAPAATTLASALVTAVAAVGLAAASIFRHERFGSSAYDLGVYDQTVWGYSQFTPTMSNTVHGTPNLLVGHFEPIVVALAPLFWAWDDVRVLLVAQAFVIALASVPLFLWARRELGVVEAILFQIAYLVFWGVLAGNIYDFHGLALAAPIISLAFYAALTERTHLLLGACLLALLTKEELTLTVVAIGVYVAVVQRRWKLGLALAGVATVAFVAVLKLLLPALTGKAYAHWHYPALGSGPGAALVHVVTHPFQTVELFFTPRAKATALFNLFAAWLFLPLLSPLVLVMIPALAVRFLGSKPEYWAQGFHYNLAIAPMLAFAAVDTTARLSRVAQGRTRTLVAPTLAVGVVLACLYFSFGRLRPLDELGRYTSTAHAAEIRACLETIPPGASVTATSALVPHLTHRREIYLLESQPPPLTEYLAVDTYTWIYPLTLGDVKSHLRQAFDRGYGVVCTRGGTAVLALGARGRTLSRELLRQLAASS